MKGLVSLIRTKKKKEKSRIMLKTYTFKRTKNSRLKLCTNLLGKKFIKIRFLRSPDCLPPAFPLKGTRWCTVCTLRSKASLKILLAYFELMTFRARSEEQILKITDRFTIFPGQQMFHLRSSSHLLVLSRQQAWKQIVTNSRTTCSKRLSTLTIILN